MFEIGYGRCVSTQKPSLFSQMKTTLINRFIDGHLGTATGFVKRRYGSEIG